MGGHLLEKSFRFFQIRKWFSVAKSIVLSFVLIGIFSIFNYLSLKSEVWGPFELKMNDFEQINSEGKSSKGNYFILDFDNDQYNSDYFISDWEWGTQYEDSTNYITSHIFAFITVYDKVNNIDYVFHARIKPKEIYQINQGNTENIKIRISKFDEEQKKFIYGNNSILLPESLNQLRENDEEYALLLYDVISEQIKSGLINDNVVFDIEHKPSRSTLIVFTILVLISLIIISIYLGIALKYSFKTVNNHLSKNIDLNDVDKLSDELNKVSRKYEYNAKEHNIYVTKSFIFSRFLCEAVPINKIKYINSCNLENGLPSGIIWRLKFKLLYKYKTNFGLDIGFISKNNKLKKLAILVPYEKDAREIRDNIISKREDIQNKLSSFWGE